MTLYVVTINIQTSANVQHFREDVNNTKQERQERLHVKLSCLSEHLRG